MKTSIKVLHTSKVRTAKNGRKYIKVLALVTIDSNEWIQEYYVFQPYRVRDT